MLSMTHSTDSKEKKEIWGDRCGFRAGMLRSGGHQGGSHPPSHSFVPGWQEPESQFPP